MLAVATGCTASVPPPTAADATWASARWPGTDLRELAEGRDLYVRKCGGCHTLYPIDWLPAARWPGTIHEMADRAALAPVERDRITRYVLTAARAPR